MSFRRRLYVEMFVFKLSLDDDLLRTFLIRESLWSTVVYVLWIQLDRLKLLSNDEPRYSTVPEENSY